MSVRKGRMTYTQSVWHASSDRAAVSPEYKVILLGAPGVGKTSFFLRIREQVFMESSSSTCPIDFLVKKVRVPSGSGEVTVKIFLYDTAGGERFRTLTSNFYQNASAAILMYSEDDSYSFDKLQIEAENAQPFLGKDFIWTLVGNKTDLQRDPMLVDSRIEAFSATLGDATHLTMSVKTGENVDRVLETVATEMFKAQAGFLNVSMSGSPEHLDTIQLGVGSWEDKAAQPSRKQGCCNWKC